MKELPIEPEDRYVRLNGNRVYKHRNRVFGSIDEVKDKYPSSESVLTQIFKVRAAKTPGGCPNCENPWENFKKVPKKHAFRCSCGFKVHPLKGTHLEHCRTPLDQVVVCIYEMFCSKNGSPATWMQRRTKKQYETCLANFHRISDWMGYCNSRKPFTPGSSIEIDIVYPRGITNHGRYNHPKKGPASERVFSVLVLVERDDPEKGFCGVTKGFHFDKTDRKEMEDFITRNVKPENRHYVFTDDGGEFSFLTTFLTHNGYQAHQKVNHNQDSLKGKYKVEFTDREGEKKTATTNTVEGANTTIKTTIHRIYRGVHPDNLQLYVDRVIFNHANKSRNFFESINELFNCLPGLFDKVDRKFLLKKRIRTKQNNSYKAVA